IAVVVLDRPNPLGGFAIEGPALGPPAAGAAGPPMPLRHGLTSGELARALNAEMGIGANLSVVPMKGWRREQWLDETGLPWADPSPDLRSLGAALLYPGLGLLEGESVSAGRGTDRPFEQVGAPGIDGTALAETLNGRGLPGVRFYPVRFTPSSGPFAREA